MLDLTESQLELRARARALAEREIAPRAAAIDRSEAYPWDNVAALTAAGFMGMTLPKALGGQGQGLREVLLVVEEMARVCGVTGRILVEANMGAVGAVMAYGSPAHQRLVADCVLSGDKPAICITEPQAGSAAADMTTRAERRGDRYVLNGHKHWITGGGVSHLHLIFARILERGEDRGIAGFLALKDEHPGLRIGRRIPAMGLRGLPETEVFLEDLELPLDRLLLPPGGAKHGFAALMTAYNGQRVGAATVALGIAQGAFDQALGYLQQRAQFGRPLAEFQGLQWMLADMSIAIEAARLMIHRAAASARSSGFPDQTAAAQAKILAAETAVKVTNDALQLHGAAGYSRDLPLERMLRDARMFTIGGGTAQVLRTQVAARLLGRKLPQTRDGYSAAPQDTALSPLPSKRRA